jgi:signal transduction histidine kinase
MHTIFPAFLLLPLVREMESMLTRHSHELRSPLHGILAAAEFMDGTLMSEFQKSLLETIHACGRTLLDTMNQVLDFSKIVSLEKSWRQIRKSQDTRLDSRGEEHPVRIDNMATMLDEYMSEDLAVLAEEVAEGVCVGHSYSRSASSGPSQTSSLAPSSRSGRSSSALSSPEREQVGDQQLNVEVVIDIKPGDWRFRTQPGALRRIIMNIFGNAMKYTDKGRVTLKLETLKSDGTTGLAKPTSPKEIVVITVSDTGKGISEEFLRRRLFTPFAQENTLAAGTGLGLSIVRSIVKSLEGTIHIRSQPGEGTTVRVSLPLVRDTGDQAISPRQPSHRFCIVENIKLLQEKYGDKTIAILGFDLDPRSSETSAAITARYIIEWFGLQLVAWPHSQSVDILIASKEDLSELRMQSFHHPSTMVVYCHNTIEYEAVRRLWSFVAPSIEFIHRPCGPYKLLRSLVRVLQRLPAKEQVVSQESVQTQDTTLDSRACQCPFSCERVGEEGSLRSRSKVRDANIEKRTLRQPSPISKSPSRPSSIVVGVLDDSAAGGQSAPAASVIINDIPASEPLVTEKKAHGSAINLLVVDDNQINLRLLLTHLHRRNPGILHSADNGKMAVEAVERRPEGYDIIFMGKQNF